MFLTCCSMKPNLCVNCKFFKKEFFLSDKFGKCSLFKVVYENDDYLVNGKNEPKKIDNYYCSIARKADTMCGKEGKLFEKNHKRG